jgi:2-amino-4-hydroxy-6-hydroxymethyldihydropteridine diphosphokinase/dihydropteroate synthase
MIILGLGTNQGDKLKNLRTALQELRKIPCFSVEKVSPIYISDALLTDNAPPEWNQPFLNCALRCETSLKPEELLHHTKHIEKKLGRISEGHWSPRIIDIDLLAWDDVIQQKEFCHLPHKFLHERPFALFPLSDVAPLWIYPAPGIFQGKTACEISRQWGSKFSGEAPLHTRQIAHRIDSPQLVGILNVTPDSFSDGGKFFSVENAIEQAKKLIQDGAEIIDIGAESTRPNATSIDPDTEWQRLEPILKNIFATEFLFKPKISIDTRNAMTAEKALTLGADIINDVSAFSDEKMQSVIAEKNCDVVFMHHVKIPEDRTQHLPLNQNPLPIIFKWAQEKISQLEKSKIAPEKIIFDVGIGFGKLAEQSLEILQNISAFRDLGVRLLVGHSRKSFMQHFTTLPSHERDLETVILSLRLANHVDFLRVHNVEQHSRGFRV